MADIGPMIVRIGADASGLQRAFDQLGGSAKQFEHGLSNIGKIGGAALLSLGIATIAAVKQAGMYAEMLDHVSQRTGISTKALQDWTVIMARSGVSMDSLTTLSKKLSQTMVEAQNPNSRAAQTFAEMGITATTVNGVLAQLADRFKMMPDGAGKTALAVDLLGKAGQQLIPILNQGSEGLKASMLRSRELGAVLSGEALSALNVADTAFDDLGVATSAAAHQFGAVMAPAVGMVVNAMATGVGTVANFFGTIASGGNSIENVLPLMEKFNTVLRATGAPGFDVENVKKNVEAQAAFGENAKRIHEAAIAQLEAEGHAQEDLGDAIVKQARLSWQAQEKAKASQVVLGQQLVSTTKIQLEQLDALNKQIFQEIFDREEAAAQADFLQGPEPDLKTGRMQLLENEVTLSKANFDLQQAFYSSAPGLIGAANAARQAGIALIEDEAELQAHLINETLVSERDKSVQLLALDADTQAKRIALMRQFPTFWEKQLQAVVASNAFSVGAIVSSWTSGVANAIVTGADFVKAAWQSTQIAILQGVLNLGVQLAAELLQQAAVQTGIMTKTASEKLLAHTATEQAMTAVTTAQEAVRVAMVVASTKAMAAANAAVIASLTSVGLAAVGVLQAALIGITGFLSAVAAAVAPIPIVGQVLAGSIIVGLTLAQVAGQAAIAAATAAIAAAGSAAAAGLSFQEGGVGSFGAGMPALLHGPEAIIPLNRRGAAFMREALGMGGGQPIMIQVQSILDGRIVAESVSVHMPSAWRRSGLPA